jgi:hypothetical protein
MMTRDKFLELLDKNGIKVRDYSLKKAIDDFDIKISEKIESNILKLVNNEETEKTVLGIDIFGYSQYEHNRQNLVPFIFDIIYQEAMHNIEDYDGCFFEGYSFEKNFMSTGDGCFQLFDNPIQAFIFNSNFYVTMHRYNAGRFYPELRFYVGEIVFRSCLTTGKVFPYENNNFGSAIINNARILSQDKLNRLLIDENTNKWFLAKIDGIENLSEILLEDLLNILEIFEDWGKTAIFRTKTTYNMNESNKYGREYSKIKNCHVQKIGNITAKSDIISIYNVEIQMYMYIFDPNSTDTGSGMVVSMGNSNTTDIVD